jgi:hypothetical protein
MQRIPLGLRVWLETLPKSPGRTCRLQGGRLPPALATSSPSALGYRARRAASFARVIRTRDIIEGWLTGTVGSGRAHNPTTCSA